MRLEEVGAGSEQGKEPFSIERTAFVILAISMVSANLATSTYYLVLEASTSKMRARLTGAGHGPYLDRAEERQNTPSKFDSYKSYRYQANDGSWKYVHCAYLHLSIMISSNLLTSCGIVFLNFGPHLVLDP